MCLLHSAYRKQAACFGFSNFLRYFTETHLSLIARWESPRQTRPHAHTDFLTVVFESFLSLLGSLIANAINIDCDIEETLTLTCTVKFKTKLINKLSKTKSKERLLPGYRYIGESYDIAIMVYTPLPLVQDFLYVNQSADAE